MLTPSHDAYPSAGLSNPTTGHTGPGSPGWVILRPNRTLSRCPSIGLVLLRELTFWSTRNVGATISDAASPVDEIEKLKARHAAEIQRIVEVAQKTVSDLVEQATEEANRRLEELTSENERLRALDETVAPYRTQIKKFGFTEA